MLKFTSLSIIAVALFYVIFFQPENNYATKQKTETSNSLKATQTKTSQSKKGTLEVSKRNLKSNEIKRTHAVNNSITDLWKNDTPNLSSIPHLPLLSYIEELEHAINNGDADAAMHLYNAHTRCSNAPKSMEEVEANATQQSPDGSYYLLRSSYEFYLERLVYCEGFDSLKGSDDQYKLAYLIKLAANKGDINAKLIYAGAGFPYPLLSDDDFIRYAQEIADHKIEAVRHLVDAKNLGSITALGALGDLYYNGVLVERNNIEAYAYYLASEQTLNSPYDNPRLPELANEMTAEELEIAIDLGNQYATCCKIFTPP